MSAEQLTSGELYEDPRAREFHKDGLRAGLTGQFQLAHEMFDTADKALSHAPDTLDRTVQLARITRDNGFTYLREATAGTPDLVINASAYLKISRMMTSPLVSGEERLPRPAEIKASTPKKARRELFSEHGATISLLARLATARAVLYNWPYDNKILVPDIDQENYGLAHEYLRRGSKGYERVSNAMVGARQERLNGNLQNMTVWLGRAAIGIAWTAAFDRNKLRRSGETFVNRIRDVISYKAAKDSVLVRP